MITRNGNVKNKKACGDAHEAVWELSADLAHCEIYVTENFMALLSQFGSIFFVRLLLTQSLCSTPGSDAVSSLQCLQKPKILETQPMDSCCRPDHELQLLQGLLRRWDFLDVESRQGGLVAHDGEAEPGQKHFPPESRL